MSLSSFNSNTLSPLKSASDNQSKQAGGSRTTTLGEYSPPRHIDDASNTDSSESSWRHLYVLPVLLLEFLALALTRAALPSMLVNQYGDNVYVVMGFVDCIRGLLAFVASPVIGRISDITGRRLCLLVTVLGTCAPVCSLAFFSWEITTLAVDDARNTTALDIGTNNVVPDESETGGFWPMILGDDDPAIEQTLHPRALTIFVVLLSLSGVFSSTFTLVFAYISDTVRQQDERVAAYGLALATFGLSFTIGPIAGGYLARSHKQYVFVASLVLTVLDLIYIYMVLPESKDLEQSYSGSIRARVSDNIDHLQQFSWNPINTLRLIASDSFLRKVSKVAFLYYTGLWALISTLSVYAVKRFHLGPERLGELMSALGLSTMIAEAVLVRIMVPMLGEVKSMKIGLASFAMQCVVLGFAYEPWHLFVCAFFSLLGNLVYPSLSSLVSASVEQEKVGESLGAVNGVKSLTEGIGPLVFGSLMTLSEKSVLPGWPYLLAALLVLAAYQATRELPDPSNEDNNEYIHELERKKHRKPETRPIGLKPPSDLVKSKESSIFVPTDSVRQDSTIARISGMFSLGSSQRQTEEVEDDPELELLLSEIDEEESDLDDDGLVLTEFKTQGKLIE